MLGPDPSSLNPWRAGQYLFKQQLLRENFIGSGSHSSAVQGPGGMGADSLYGEKTQEVCREFPSNLQRRADHVRHGACEDPTGDQGKTTH